MVCLSKSLYNGTDVMMKVDENVCNTKYVVYFFVNT
jgi:hypothetical protein